MEAATAPASNTVMKPRKPRAVKIAEKAPLSRRPLGHRMRHATATLTHPRRQHARGPITHSAPWPGAKLACPVLASDERTSCLWRVTLKSLAARSPALHAAAQQTLLGKTPEIARLR